MNFDDTPEEAAYRTAARTFIEAHKGAFLGSDLAGFDAVRRWQAVRHAGGWGCLQWPKAYGGQGASAVQALIYSQEEEAAGISLLSVANAITIGMAAATIMQCGTQAQKERHLPRIARGEEIWCQLFSEPSAGSDLAGIRTRAVRDGDDWVVSGQKVWTSFAHYADFAILITRTDPAAPKHAGLTYFLLDMTSPGMTVKPIRQASGGSDFNEVFLEAVRIPDSNRVGEVGDGWRVALTTLMNERAAIGSIFPTNFDDAWRLAAQTPLGDRPAIEAGGVLQLLADWYVWRQGLKNFSLRLQSALSQGRMPGPEASIGKLMLGARRQLYLFELLDLLDIGGAALASGEDGDIHFSFLRVIGNRLEGGTDEILRNIIGERVLGLPPEPRVDKALPFNEVPSG
ncbi:MAG: acyl-CoA dehydrogenase family protein [Alphaproteobacteria bacterium]|nr:acyl-CoA dehydrogenase family protein [Alphaproteobacteria bacterium]